MEDKAKRRLPPPLSGSAFDVVGLTAISRILSALPVDFPAAIVIVQHLDPRHSILNWAPPCRLDRPKRETV